MVTSRDPRPMRVMSTVANTAIAQSASRAIAYDFAMSRFKLRLDQLERLSLSVILSSTSTMRPKSSIKKSGN